MFQWTWQRIVLGNVPEFILQLKTPIAALLTTIMIPSVSNLLILFLAIIVHAILQLLLGWSNRDSHSCKFNKSTTTKVFSILSYVLHVLKTYFLLAFWINYHELHEVP